MVKSLRTTGCRPSTPMGAPWRADEDARDIPRLTGNDPASRSLRKRLFMRSVYCLTVMLLVIVGRLVLPGGIYVGMYNGIQLVQLAH